MNPTIKELAENYKQLGGTPSEIKTTLEAVQPDIDTAAGFIATLEAAGQTIPKAIIDEYGADATQAKKDAKDQAKAAEIEAAKIRVQEAKPEDLKEAALHLARITTGDQGEGRKVDLTPDSPEAILARIKNKPPVFTSRFKMKAGKDEPLTFPTGALSFIVAPSGHGKTTMLLNLLADASRDHQEKRHYLFSFEEDAAMVYLKTFNSWADKQWGQFKGGNISTFEHYVRTNKPDFFRTTENFGIEVHIADFKSKWDEFWKLVNSGTITIKQGDFMAEDLCHGIRELAKEGNAGIVLIDYAQLLYLDNPEKGTARTEELKRIMLALKDVAVETGLPIILAAQFNRQVVHASFMHMSKIADAADIERAAAKVIGLWNGNKAARATGENAEKAIEGFNESAEIKAQEYKNDEPQDNGTMFLRILKDRNGPSELWATYPLSGGRLNITREPIASGYGEIYGPAKPKKEKPGKNVSTDGNGIPDPVF